MPRTQSRSTHNPFLPPQCKIDTTFGKQRRKRTSARNLRRLLMLITDTSNKSQTSNDNSRKLSGKIPLRKSSCNTFPMPPSSAPYHRTTAKPAHFPARSNATPIILATFPFSTMQILNTNVKRNRRRRKQAQSEFSQTRPTPHTHYIHSLVDSI